MKPSKRERQLLRGLTPHKAHSDELAQPTPEELEGSVSRYDGPFEPLPDWEEADAMQPTKPQCGLDELLEDCDESAPYPDELRAWDEAPAVGREPGSQDDTDQGD